MGWVWYRRWGQGTVLSLRTSDSIFWSLQPPTPETDYPELLTSYPEEVYFPVGSFSEPGPTSPLTAPPGWSCHISPDKQMLYTNHFTQEQVGAALADGPRQTQGHCSQLSSLGAPLKTFCVCGGGD
jgi:hypothetical protein